MNIRDAGQERWLRRYVYWIPALHLDGREVAKGRWGESEVLKALEEWDQDAKNQSGTDSETRSQSHSCSAEGAERSREEGRTAQTPQEEAPKRQ